MLFRGGVPEDDEQMIPSRCPENLIGAYSLEWQYFRPYEISLISVKIVLGV
jgi:hypothetical protein